MLLSSPEFSGDVGPGSGRPRVLGMVDHASFRGCEVRWFRVHHGRENNCADGDGECWTSTF